MALQVRIASPCSESWNSMSGDERVRHCARCKLNVFNTREMTEAEVTALLERAEGRVCARIYQRADGTILTRDCPTGLQKLRRRALAGVTVAASLVLVVFGFRLMGRRSCPTSADASWFERTVGARVVAARETLRETRTLGPVVDELFPQTKVLMGDMPYLPPPKGVAP